MVDTESIRTVFGIIGNIISFALLACAVPTFYRMIKTNSVEELKPEYNLATTMSCLFWVFYGMPFIHPRSVLVATAYGIVLAIQLAYLFIFLLYANDNKRRMYVGGVFLIELVVVSLVIGSVIGLAHTVDARMKVVGAFCLVSGVAATVPDFMCLAQVTRTKSVEGIPFLNVLISTLYQLCWFLYACLKFDIFLWAVNFYTSFLGIYLLILYGGYYKSTPKSGADRNLATTKVWDQRTGKWTDKKLDTAELQLP